MEFTSISLKRKCIAMQISLYHSCLSYNTKIINFGFEFNPKNSGAVYLISLGLQFNWSEHRPVKAEAAGSSPVSPDGSNKYINSSLHFLFLAKEAQYRDFFVISHQTQINIYINCNYFNQYRLVGQRQNWMNPIIGNILFSIPRDSILDRVFQFIASI